MADIKFQCPECKQKIAAQPSAAGMKIDCPRCFSTIVIPKAKGQPAVVEVRRRLATLPGAQDDLYRTIEEQQRKLAAAGEEVAKEQAEVRRMQGELQRLREEVAAVQTDREGLVHRLHGAEASRDAASAAQVQLAQLRAKIAALTETRDEFSARAARAEESCNGMRERLINDEGNRAELKAQIGLLQGQVERLQTAREEVERLKPIEEELVQLREQHSTAITERDSLRANVEHVTAELEALRAERQAPLPEHEAAAPLAEAAVRQQAEEWQRQAESSQTECEKLRAERQALESARDEIRARLTEREATLVKTSLTREAAWQDLERMRQAATAFTREKESLQRAEREAKEAVAAMTAERDAERAVTKEHQKALNEAAVALASARLEAARVESVLVTVSAAHDRVRSEGIVMRRQSAVLEDDLRRRTEELEAVRQRDEGANLADQGSMQAQIVALRTELETAQEKLTQAEDATQVYRTLIEDTDQTLSKLEAERDKYKAELQAAKNPLVSGKRLEPLSGKKG